MDIDEIRMPTEVWEAVEGYPARLALLLRGGKPLTMRTRTELADWLEGSLAPVKALPHRPSRDPLLVYALSICGHDITTKLGGAGYRFDQVRKFIRRKEWHIGNTGWRERLLERVASRHGVPAEQLRTYLKRARKKQSFRMKTAGEQRRLYVQGFLRTKAGSNP